jgi:hypothetical protein
MIASAQSAKTIMAMMDGHRIFLLLVDLTEDVFVAREAMDAESP